MKVDLENLPSNISQLQGLISLLASENKSLHSRNEILSLEKIDLLSKKEFLSRENEVLSSLHESLLLKSRDLLSEKEARERIISDKDLQISRIEALMKEMSERYNLLSQKYERSKFHLSKLLREKYGIKSEKGKNILKKLDELEDRIEDSETNAGYHDLSQEEEKKLEDNKKEAEEKKKKSRKGGGRKALDPNIPREDINVEAPCICSDCGGDKFSKICDDISEILEFIPGSYVVKRIIRPRLSCVGCKKIVQGELPSSAIEKSKVGSGFLANMLVDKYLYHMPIYRQWKKLFNEGIEIPRSTMNGWIGKISRMVGILSDHLRKDILSSSYLHGDDTPVKVLSPGFGKTKTGRIWIYVRDGRGHGGREPPGICYYYSADRSGERPKSHLKEFKGVLHADAYAGYNGVYESKDENGELKEKVKESNCWAHVRRKFYEIAVISSNAVVANWALEKIGELYKIEEEIRGESSSKRLEVRIKESKVKVDEFFEYIRLKKKDLPSKIASVKAINYALNQEKGLREFLRDGKIEIDNNIAERGMRCVALGRKNWLFAGSDFGGEIAANMYSLLQSAELNGINPLKYMTQVLKRLPDHSIQKLDELLPWNIDLKVENPKAL